MVASVDEKKSEEAFNAAKVKLKQGLKTTMSISSEGNAYLQESQFWKLYKEDQPACSIIMRTSVGLVSLLACLLEPFMPSFSLEGSNWAAKDLGSCCIGNDLQQMEWNSSYKLRIYALTIDTNAGGVFHIQDCHFRSSYIVCNGCIRKGNRSLSQSFYCKYKNRLFFVPLLHLLKMMSYL